MQRGLTQILFRYLPESVFRYEDGRAWCTVKTITQREADNLRPALQEAVHNVLSNWQSLQEQGGPYPDPIRQPNRYSAGEPYQVYYTLFPLIFICRTCGRVHYYSDVDRLRAVNDRLRCMNCGDGSKLRQLPYAFIHECGNLDSLYMPGGHPRHVLHIEDRGNFLRSRWYCETCGPLPLNGLGFRTCSCPSVGGRRPLMRGTMLQGSNVYNAHTVSLLNITDDSYLNWSRTPDASPILVAGLCNLPEYDGTRLRQYAELPGPTTLTTAEEEDLRADLEASGIVDRAQQDEVIRRRTERRNPQFVARQNLVQRVDDLFVGTAVLEQAPDSRTIREYLYARDHPSPKTRSLISLRDEASNSGDIASLQRHEVDLGGMLDLGLSDIRVMTDLPVVLCAIGYSRVMHEHQSQRGAQAITASLRLFPQSQGRFPIYTVQNTTEGLLFSLNPFRWAAWLAENNLATPPSEGFRDESSVRAWLVRLMPQFLVSDHSYLVRLPWEDTTSPVDYCSSLSFGLLHSMSHLFLASAEQYVGFETDSLSEYLFPISGSGLIYASGHKEFTLGGIVSVFQQELIQWLQGVRETAYRCMLDPLCHQKGGACHACVYLRFSCQHFNRTVSRSFLVGGRVSGYSLPVVGYWSARVTARAEALYATGVKDE